MSFTGNPVVDSMACSSSSTIYDDDGFGWYTVKASFLVFTGKAKLKVLIKTYHIRCYEGNILSAITERGGVDSRKLIRVSILNIMKGKHGKADVELFWG